MNSKPVSGVIVYVIRNNREVLFMRRSGGQYKGGWWPVAGTREDAETPDKCARRELEEETGIVADKLLDFGLQLPHHSGDSVLQVYVCPVPPGTSIKLNYEHDDYAWLNSEDAIAAVPESSQVYLRHLASYFLAGEDQT